MFVSIEFLDGTITPYMANTIAHNMIAQCNPSGNQTAIMEFIVGHKTDRSEVLHSNRFITKGRNKYLRKTIKGWFLCVQWKDETTSWEKLSDLKESYPHPIHDPNKALEVIGSLGIQLW